MRIPAPKHAVDRLFHTAARTAFRRMGGAHPVRFVCSSTDAVINDPIYLIFLESWFYANIKSCFEELYVEYS